MHASACRALRFAVIGWLLLASGCSGGLPPDKAAYAGEWRGKGVRLVITETADVDYDGARHGVAAAVKGPIRSFEGDSFVVGLGAMSARFVVSKPPYQEGGVWKMVVDGVELTKAP